MSIYANTYGIYQRTFTAAAGSGLLAYATDALTLLACRTRTPERREAPEPRCQECPFGQGSSSASELFPPAARATPKKGRASLPPRAGYVSLSDSCASPSAKPAALGPHTHMSPTARPYAVHVPQLMTCANVSGA